MTMTTVTTDAELSRDEVARILELADAMIPGNADWPAPSSTDLDRYIREYCERGTDRRALRDVVLRWSEYGVGEESFLLALEKKNPTSFRVLLDFVYLGYYSRPEVVRRIQVNCGCDYISPPQPHGYSLPLETDVHPTKRGGFTKTSDVKRVDLSKLPREEFWEVS